MKIYALYYKDTFVVAFPNRADCIYYGKKHYEGLEWDCNIVEKFIHDYPQYSFTNPYNPLTTPNTIPCTPPIPLKTAPYTPNIWCEGPKGPSGGIGPTGIIVDYTQTPKTN